MSAVPDVDGSVRGSRPPGSRLKASIIVNNWNYANYLGQAIDSALDQTRPADEVIVVDDGSTDGSRAIIATYGDRVIPVLQANGGQAAAFESGFRRSSGDIIVFLDADDVLLPEMLETILAAWDQSYAAICWGLEMIDTEGRPVGNYPSFPEDVDHWPVMAEIAGFDFKPTSGNAFSRGTVETALPFPTGRWRISADAYLLRVAALAGRIRPLQQNLGCYRIHSANNYHRIGSSDVWVERRALLDSGGSR